MTLPGGAILMDPEAHKIYLTVVVLYLFSTIIDMLTYKTLSWVSVDSVV